MKSQSRKFVRSLQQLMTGNAYVDQAAVLIVCSSTKADELDTASSKRVYLHGCAQGDDHWYVTERWNLHSSPAIRQVVAKTFAMADKTLSNVAVFDQLLPVGGGDCLPGNRLR